MTAIFDFDVFPVIETQRLILRKMVLEDAEAVSRIFSDVEVLQYYDMSAFTGIEEAQAMIVR